MVIVRRDVWCLCGGCVVVWRVCGCVGIFDDSWVSYHVCIFPVASGNQYDPSGKTQEGHGQSTTVQITRSGGVSVWVCLVWIFYID